MTVIERADSQFNAGLFIRTLQNVKAIDAGIRVENVLLASMSPALNGYKRAS